MTRARVLGGNITATIAMATGKTPPPPNPCIARKAISSERFWLRPASAEPTMKIARPTRKTFRLLVMSESLAKIGMEMVEETRYEPATNVTPSTWCRSPAMVGRTVETTRESIAPISMARNIPTSTRVAVIPVRTVGEAGASAPTATAASVGAASGPDPRVVLFMADRRGAAKISLVARIRANRQRRIYERGTKGRRRDVRRLTIELDLKEMSKFEDNPILEKIKSLEILQFLKDGPEEFAAIFRIEFEDPASRIEDYVADDILEIQMLEDEGAGTYTYFIKSRPMAVEAARFDPFSAGGYLSIPFEIKDGRARMTYLGSGRQVRAFLEGVERAGVRYRVASVTDAKFSHDSPLSRLTEKQRRVLVSAYRLGYYDEPRRISSQELARRMRIGSSTLVNHRRRAERRLLRELIEG